MGNFGETLDGLMIEKNLDGVGLAKVTNLSKSAINLWRKNERDIRLSNLIRLCEYFDCSLEYLSGRSENFSKFGKPNSRNFADNVRAVMNSRSVTTYKLGKDTRFKNKQFNKWKKGAEPQLSTLVLLADYLSCTLDELVGIE